MFNKKLKQEFRQGEEYAFREGMRATLDLTAAGHSATHVRKISKDYIAYDFGTGRKSRKKYGYHMSRKEGPHRQLGRYIKTSATPGNKYILYDW